MIVLTPQHRILVAREHVDFRKGINGLVRICRDTLASDPFSGALFEFRNRPATALKLLVYDGQGFWLCQKRLSQGRFRHWPKLALDSSKAGTPLLAHELQVLLCAGKRGIDLLEWLAGSMTANLTGEPNPAFRT